MSKRRRDRGFTLVEILIAIVLVGILSAVVVVGVGTLTSKGSSAACATSLDAARVASTAHTVSTGSAPASFADMVTSGALSVPSGVTVDTGGRRILGNGWQLVMSPGQTIRLACTTAAPAQFALDATSAAPAAVFSLRQTSATYSGPAVRVRRSSDNAEQDIGFASVAQRRQNLSQNTQLLGALPGSPGTLPDRWIQRVSTVPLQVLGSGIAADGQAYVDLRFVGTASGPATNRISLDGAVAGQGVTSTMGQRVLVSAGIQLLAGVAPSIGLGMAERDSSNALSGGSGGVGVVPTTNLVRRSFATTTSGSTTAVVQGELTFTLTTGASYDFSIRIVQPNVELDRTMNARPLTTNAITTVAEPGDLDLDALEAFVGADSAFVVTWYDQSGNGRHATQAATTAQPRIVDTGATVTLGGRVVPFFDGDDVLALGGSGFGTAATPFAAVTTFRRQDPAAGNRAVWGNRGYAHPNDGGRYLRSWLGAVGYNHPGCCAPGSIAAADSDGIVHSIAVSSNEMRQRVNGGADTTSSLTGMLNVTRGWALGAQADGDGQFMLGSVAEVVFFDRATTGAEIQSLERGQGAYFGVTVA